MGVAWSGGGGGDDGGGRVAGFEVRMMLERDIFAFEGARRARGMGIVVV